MNRYPVIVETRERHVVWQEADDLEEAVELLKGDPEWYELLGNDTRVEEGYGWDVSAPDEWSWYGEVYGYGRHEGPARGCGECGRTAYKTQSFVPHADGCTQKPGESDGR
ncbi:hypothetical protein [Streptomyces sp. ISL-94]|uniref:hypothetical protein n=1 Tax=Streptomyces sp. ISL-94 TaxID=2819190 RepID=UPI001BE8732B|nr:hypothetical protein [Streptomyces sp. ISL-94]MBT2477587.1 hypothetical protein [Streptomyces sp. ISL-94]